MHVSGRDGERKTKCCATDKSSFTHGVRHGAPSAHCEGSKTYNVVGLCTWPSVLSLASVAPVCHGWMAGMKKGGVHRPEQSPCRQRKNVCRPEHRYTHVHVSRSSTADSISRGRGRGT